MSSGQHGYFFESNHDNSPTFLSTKSCIEFTGHLHHKILLTADVQTMSVVLESGGLANK